MIANRGMLRSVVAFIFLPFFSLADAQVPKHITVNIVTSDTPSARINFGVNKLAKTLQQKGYGVKLLKPDGVGKANGIKLFVGVNRNDFLIDAIKNNNIAIDLNSHAEGFSIGRNGQAFAVAGFDPSGALYGCEELCDSLSINGLLPAKINMSDQPQMVLRGACIGVQKPYYLPGRHVYEYPYTPETFPWFYDKGLWIKYLDSLVENRMNSLYLWNGHPFASLVKLKDYPYAVEVDDATFKKNEEMFRFLTTEADKRGIWVIQMFYNIIVSKPFAEKNNMVTQDRNRPIIPIIADYTRKSIAAFVEKYPNVGLLVALGEAMEGVGNDDVEWFTKTIIPGVQDGMKALNLTKEPPIVLRAHDTDPASVMQAALPLYKNLYTMAKYNGEALTTYTPRGPWAELHRNLSSLGSIQIENVHILANLEPFRYGATDFIQKCVKAMHDVYHSNGLHLYPESSYWDWPYTADNATPRLLQIDRDWIWYKAWSRYAWNVDRQRPAEDVYWASLLGDKYGTGETHGREILAAYEAAGEIAPKLLRRFGITDGNRQTLTLGMLMTQLINPFRYGLFTLLYNSEGPEGEMLTDYAEKEWKHEAHTGETPVDVINDVRRHGADAVAAIDKAALSVTKEKAAFSRVQNDMHCYNALANSYAEKTTAALLVLRYKYSNDVNDLDSALPHLQKSVAWFRQLADLTRNTYLYANSMQTQQRKIPVGGNDATMKTWVELLPVYENELAIFKKRIDSLKGPAQVSEKRTNLLHESDAVTILSPVDGYYSIRTGSSMFSDTGTYIKDYAEELQQLQAIKFNKAHQLDSGTIVQFRNTKPVKVLVGYFNNESPRFLQPPQLETDASANDRGQAEAKIRNAILISGLPPINVHTFSFKPGENTLSLGKGAALVLGFINDDEPVKASDAGLVPGGVKKELDWLFE